MGGWVGGWVRLLQASVLQTQICGSCSVAASCGLHGCETLQSYSLWLPPACPLPSALRSWCAVQSCLNSWKQAPASGAPSIWERIAK